MEMEAEYKLPIHVESLMNILPQRYPMLMLDRVTRLDNDKIIAIKNISGNEPCFVGHFPNKKIYPGVLITESIAQASIVLLNRLGGSKKDEKLPVLYHTNVKFKRLVVPGDQLIIHVDLRKKIKESAIVDAVVYVNDDLAVKGSLTFTMKEM